MITLTVTRQGTTSCTSTASSVGTPTHRHRHVRELMHPRRRSDLAGDSARGSFATPASADFQLYGSVLTPAQVYAALRTQAVNIGGPLPANTTWCVAAGATFDLAGTEPDRRLAVRRRQRGRRHGDQQRRQRHGR